MHAQDVEGHEAEVLMGAHQLLRTSRPVVITEGYEYSRRAAGPKGRLRTPQHPSDVHVAKVLEGRYGYVGDEIPEGASRLRLRSRPSRLFLFSHLHAFELLCGCVWAVGCEGSLWVDSRVSESNLVAGRAHAGCRHGGGRQ